MSSSRVSRRANHATNNAQRSSVGATSSSSSNPSPFTMFRRSSPTCWIGTSMFCLVIVYVGVVVVVAKHHMQVQHQLQLLSVDGLSQQQDETTNINHHLLQQQQQAKQLRADSANVGIQDKPNPKHAAMAGLGGSQSVNEARILDKQQPKGDDGDDDDGNDDAEEDDEEEDGDDADVKDKSSNGKQPDVSNQQENQAIVRPRHERLKARDDFGHGGEPQVMTLKPPDTSNLQFTASTTEHDIPLDQHPTPNNILKAYIEQVDFDEWEQKPLPVRSKATKEHLREISYSRLHSCRNLMAQFPVDDTPTNHDPFLPWIHDVFPTADGKFIQFVAQNKRRCRTGSTKSEKEALHFMQPQASLFQHVPVQRVHNDNDSETRYKLVPYEKADADGLVTRFICRFKPSMEETLSVHNVDYDWTALRKKYRHTFDKDDGGLKSIHTTQLMFQCPVPEHLQETVRTGAAVQNDWTSLFVDLIPIRTPPRYGSPNRYLAPWYSEFQAPGQEAFRPSKEWGDEHILPRIEDSGRWENIPICQPSLMAWEGATKSDLPATKEDSIPKRHKLVSCIWASAGYATRGNRFAINDGQRRLLEWMTHNKNIGFDHFYIYDNTGAFRNDTSLKAVADLFPGEATIIPWPSTICNNNPNNVDSPGERSSQYAAESSCRLRFGAHVDWIGQFDIDEYLIPMGDHTTATSLLAKLDKEDTKIISFPSWRAWPRWEHIGPIDKIEDSKVCWSDEPCFHLTIPLTTTMLQAYNCDRQLPGKKAQSMPAEKQIYKADYVTQHFVHYSAATTLSALNRSEFEKQFPWRYRAFPDRRQRFANEVTEGLMIHSKAVATQDTVGWERVCHIDIQKETNKWKRGLCRLGVPWPVDPGLIKQNATEEGWAYNCYVNRKVEEYFVPRLYGALKDQLKIFNAQ
ncbi:hypothetical protein MPSEU_000910400 [Mayamaea pseudoterrestris]|nr:hypothetical protein MPSEU_000910400 [Mayamaea pseudoterrestris]